MYRVRHTRLFNWYLFWEICAEELRKEEILLAISLLGLLPHVLMSEVRQHMYYNKKIEGREGVFWASLESAV